MALKDLSDESILTLYENIRRQVEADQHRGVEFRLLGETAKQVPLDFVAGPRHSGA